jgi:hypothetical protein
MTVCNNIERIMSEVNDMYDSKEFTALLEKGGREFADELMRRLQIIECEGAEARASLRAANSHLGHNVTS